MRLSSPIISLGRGDAAAVFRFVLIPRRKTEAIPLGIGSFWQYDHASRSSRYNRVIYHQRNNTRRHRSAPGWISFSRGLLYVPVGHWPQILSSGRKV